VCTTVCLLADGWTSADVSRHANYLFSLGLSVRTVRTELGWTITFR